MSEATTKRPFQVIDDITPALVPAAEAQNPPPKDGTAAARQMLMLALRSLSQRALTALTNGFSLFLVTLTFILFGRVLDDPTPYKLGAVGGFSVFCLLIDIVRRWTK